MPLVIAGIDEAGYGPLLGPMCVGMSVFRIVPWREGDPAPDLWKMLAPQVARKPGKSGALAIDDSKKLKLSNDSVSQHPLTHLERAVLAGLRCREGDPASPADDAALHEALGATLAPFECYAGAPLSLPAAWSASQLDIAGNLLRAALARAEVSLLALRCDTIGEDRFNETVERTGTKASVTLRAIAGHLRALLALPLAADDSVRLVCDRLGGRTDYSAVLERMAREIDPGAAVTTTEETDRRSRYQLIINSRPIGVVFQTEGDAAYLPVSLASMVAKYIRELAMARFNRHWSARFAAVKCVDGAGRAAGSNGASTGIETSSRELKPTAGYRNDATRWLRDAAPILSADDRRVLIRRA